PVAGIPAMGAWHRSPSPRMTLSEAEGAGFRSNIRCDTRERARSTTPLELEIEARSNERVHARSGRSVPGTVCRSTGNRSRAPHVIGYTARDLRCGVPVLHRPRVPAEEKLNDAPPSRPFSFPR